MRWCAPSVPSWRTTWACPWSWTTARGANANIAGEAVAKAPADGYTLLYNTSSIVISPHLYANLPYDVTKDLAPVALTASIPLVLVASPDAPFSNMKEFVAYLKANPGKVSYGSSGAGNITHLPGGANPSGLRHDRRSRALQERSAGLEQHPRRPHPVLCGQCQRDHSSIEAEATQGIGRDQPRAHRLHSAMFRPWPRRWRRAWNWVRGRASWRRPRRRRRSSPS